MMPTKGAMREDGKPMVVIVAATTGTANIIWLNILFSIERGKSLKIRVNFETVESVTIWSIELKFRTLLTHDLISIKNINTLSEWSLRWNQAQLDFVMIAVDCC